MVNQPSMFEPLKVYCIVGIKHVTTTKHEFLSTKQKFDKMLNVKVEMYFAYAILQFYTISVTEQKFVVMLN